MTFLVHHISARAWFGLLTLVPILFLLLLVLLAPPDGNERAQLLQFVGRLHTGRGDLRRYCGRSSRMVSCPKRWLFRSARDAAHVGWSIRRNRSLVVLALSGAEQRIAPRSGLCHRATSHSRSGVLYGLSRWPGITRGASPNGTYAGTPVHIVRASRPRDF